MLLSGYDTYRMIHKGARLLERFMEANLSMAPTCTEPLPALKKSSVEELVLESPAKVERCSGRTLGKLFKSCVKEIRL